MHKIAILASGSGSNAENIVRHFHGGDDVRVAVVLSNKADAGVHERMQCLGVETVTLGNDVWADRPSEVIAELEERSVELVVLAGFLRKIHPDIVAAYRGRMLNIHPSLLPAYGGKGMYGRRVHEAVLAAGERETGVTVHHVTDEIDGGAIVAQDRVPIAPGETVATLEAKIHHLEHSLYPRAIAATLGL